MEALPVLAFCSLLVAAQFAPAQTTPTWMNYQGKLTTGAGVALPDGAYPVTFKLFSTPTGGTALWTETKTIQIHKGVFATQMGLPLSEGGVPFPAGLFSQRLWLGITPGTGAELVPRQELGASPFALGMYPNSITTNMIQNNAVTTGKLADNSVTSAKLASDVASLGKMTGNLLSIQPYGPQILPNQYFGMALADRFTYGTSQTGNYSLGWYDTGDPNGWTSRGPVAGLSSYGGIKMFTRSAYRFGIHPDGMVYSKGPFYIDAGGFGGDPAYELCIGDTDTGFDWRGDGTLWLMANGGKTATIAANYFEVHGSFINSSSRRYKDNVRPLTNATDIINSLKPVRYNWKDILNQKADIGFIAEDVAKVVPEITAKDSQGRVEGIDYSRFSAILVRAMQEQDRAHSVEKRKLEQRLISMEERLAALESRK